MPRGVFTLSLSLFCLSQITDKGRVGFYLSAKAAFQQGRYRDLFRLRQLQDAGFFWWYKTLSPSSLTFYFYKIRLSSLI